MSKIYFIRGTKVILDRDLAELYKVDTKQLKRAVRRNIDRFPDDFMFELSKDELANWRYQFGTSKGDIKGLRFAPFAFTEYGLLMLASVLNSERAIQINIQIVRIFSRMRKMIESHADILNKLEQLEKKDIELDEKVTLIFNYLKQLEQSKQQETDFKQRKRIGYKPD
ncbi:MAG: ORF6N domain-containing protein [Bacteroidales bacterium]|nr:ORF6N domain-containing protein [Bacteroidales bacterium]MBK7627170.1 ORF6N domain-containing protein [Bacteroidales bacterium]